MTPSNRSVTRISKEQWAEAARHSQRIDAKIAENDKRIHDLHRHWKRSTILLAATSALNLAIGVTAVTGWNVFGLLP